MAHGVRASHRGGGATGSDVPSDLECYPLVQDLIVQWVTANGPFAIFGLLVLGIFGLPVPDETLLTFAGVLISQGKLRLLPTITAAFLGSIVGISLSYVVGRVVGLRKLKAIHLNDSKRERGSRVDRHARAGEGVMGLETFARIVNDRRFRGLPLVVETPGPLAEWKKEIARLRGLVRPEGKSGRRPAAVRRRRR